MYISTYAVVLDSSVATNKFQSHILHQSSNREASSLSLSYIYSQ